MNEEQLNKVFTAITDLETKVNEGFTRIEETKADKSDIVRIDQHLDRLTLSFENLSSRVEKLEETVSTKSDMEIATAHTKRRMISTKECLTNFSSKRSSSIPTQIKHITRLDT